jgi:hypothetical protein
VLDAAMGQVAPSWARASPRALSDRAKQIGRTLSGALPSKSPREVTRQTAAEGTDASAFSTYQAVRPKEGIPQLIWCMKRHALFAWIVLPSWALAQALIPFLQPTQADGYSNPALSVLLIVEIHHMWVEMQAWDLATGMLLSPEKTIMRQYGIYSSRWHLVALGLIEVLDLYTDLVFPLLVPMCEPRITAHWVRQWLSVPVIGPSIAQVVGILNFGRVATFFVVGMIAINILYLSKLMWSVPSTRDDQDSEAPARIRAEEFLQLAQYANAAMMPSVAYLCEEMSDQRRWVAGFDPAQDAALSTQYHEHIKLGAADDQTAERNDSMIEGEMEKQEHAAKAYFTLLLLVKVILGHCIQQWIQGSFFGLSWVSVGMQVKAKVMLSIVLSTIIAFVRCLASTGHLGCLGWMILICVVLFSIWNGLRMLHTFICEDHLWNLTSGCVRRTP